MNSFVDDSRLNDKRNVFHILAKTYREKFMEMISEVEVFPRQIPMLMTIKKLDGCTQKELAIIFNYKPASITDALKRLEKSELIERKQDKKDLRLVRVFITQKGKALLNKAIEIQEKVDAICYAGFTDSQREEFKYLVEKIINNLDRKGS